MVKKTFISIVVLALALVCGVTVGKALESRKDRNVVKVPPVSRTAIPKIAGSDFIWGVQGGAYQLNNKIDTFHPENVDKQIKLTQDLGANLIRANLEISVSKSPFKITLQETSNDSLFTKISQANLQTLMVIDPDIPSIPTGVDLESEGYKLGTYAATRYKGKVKYYQIANEVSGTIVRPPEYSGAVFDGENGIQYSKERYDKVLSFVKGMSRGIRENDPQAKIALCGHWILYDIFGKLIEDGADFDIIGWSWYSPDGIDVTKREYNWGDYMNLAEKLSQYKKELWIVESNSDHGSYFDGKISSSQGKIRQAEFISEFAKNIYDSGYFKAYIVFMLLDNPIAEEAGNTKDAHWGLVEVKKVGSENKIIKNKPAFNAYRDTIKTLSK